LHGPPPPHAHQLHKVRRKKEDIETACTTHAHTYRAEREREARGEEERGRERESERARERESERGRKGDERE
tara:strand:+ start:500 stop:715 length:216 start_codon:yes stop_codon:yes gene_type:complete